MERDELFRRERTKMKSPQRLDAMGQHKWQTGLCHIFAEALKDFLETGELICLWADGGFVHLYLAINGLGYDSENKGTAVVELQKHWRTKINPTMDFQFAVGTKLTDFVQYGITLGDQWNADFYAGPERDRWYQEAKVLIENDDFFIDLKSRLTKSK